MKSKQLSRHNGDVKDDVRRRERHVNVRMDNLSSNKVVIERRIVATGTISTNAAGFIVSNFVTTDQARSLGSDFGSFASRYTAFRVRACRIRLFPLVDVTMAVNVGGGAVTPHPQALVFASYREGLSYATYASAASGTDSRIFCGRERCIEYSADWSNNPDAKLWSPTNAAIPTSNVFGIQFLDTGAAPASGISTVYYRSVLDWDVQFQGPA
jgi:hypothetical protein